MTNTARFASVALVVLCSDASIAQQQGPNAPEWKVETETSPLTDKEKVRATVVVALSPNQGYELTVECEDSEMLFAIATFQLNAARNEIEARDIPFTDVTTNGKPIRDSVQIRVDGAPAASGRIAGEYSNGGVLIPTLQQRKLLPETRLVVGEIFPGETVVFPFDALTSDEKVTLRRVCTRPDNEWLPTSLHLRSRVQVSLGDPQPRIAFPDVKVSVDVSLAQRFAEQDIFILKVLRPDPLPNVFLPSRAEPVHWIGIRQHDGGLTLAAFRGLEQPMFKEMQDEQEFACPTPWNAKNCEVLKRADAQLRREQQRTLTAMCDSYGSRCDTYVLAK